MRGRTADNDDRLAFLGYTSCGLLFLLVAFQMVPAFLYVKALLFVVVLGGSLYAYASGRARIDLHLGMWTVGLATASFFFVIEGLVAGNPGASKQALVYVVWPLAYLVWVGALASQRLLRCIHKTVVFGTLFIGLYGCLYVLTQLSVIPETRLVTWLSFGWEQESFGAHEGFTGMQFPGLNSLPFLVPYLLAYVSTEVEERSRLWKVLSWAACFLGLAVTVIAGRRAVMVVACLSLPLTLLFRSFQPEAERRVSKRPFMVRWAILLSGVAVIFLLLNFIYQFDLAALWDRMVEGFAITAESPDDDALVRHQQIVALLRGWLDHPFLGAGHGASVYGSIRSETLPWAYELGYIALLFQTGAVGVAMYAAGVLWILFRGVNAVKAGWRFGGITIPLLVGFCCALVAQATNPYLDRFDGMWMFFLPLAVINCRFSRELVRGRALMSSEMVEAR